MRDFFKSLRFKVMLAVVIALIAGIIFAAATTSGSSPLSSAASVVFSPLQKIATVLADKINDINGSFVGSSVYLEEISELNEEILELEEQLADYERTKQQLEAYEDFLELKENNSDFELVAAQVISRDSADSFYSFTLNVGTSDGVSVNDPVVYGSYVVGVVDTVSIVTCTVKTILDPDLNISVYEMKTNENGYCTTTIELSAESLCLMAGLTSDTAISVSGIVCTSGLAGVFPRDLIVGFVTEVRNSDTDVSCYAVVEPGVDISSLSDVCVITAFDGQAE